MPNLTDAILDCACGIIHETMPTSLWNGSLIELVCREHRTHTPCKECITAWLGVTSEGLEVEA